MKCGGAFLKASQNQATLKTQPHSSSKHAPSVNGFITSVHCTGLMLVLEQDTHEPSLIPASPTLCPSQSTPLPL